MAILSAVGQGNGGCGLLPAAMVYNLLGLEQRGEGQPAAGMASFEHALSLLGDYEKAADATMRTTALALLGDMAMTSGR